MIAATAQPAPLDTVLTAGSHKGDTLAHIMAHHPRYAMWVLTQHWVYDSKFVGIAAALTAWRSAQLAEERQNDVWHLYWHSDIPNKEIAEAYGIRRPSEVHLIAGPRKTGAVCPACSDEIVVYAKTEGEGSCSRCAARIASERRAEWELRDRARADRLRELRTMPYSEYLWTPEWRATREAALKRAGYRCQTCAALNGLQVHHRTYARLGMEWARDLIVLCSGCHGLFHENADLADRGRADDQSRGVRP